MGRLTKEMKAVRDAAVAQGLKVYEGKPCIKCGATERYVSNGDCRACANGRMRSRYNEDPEYRERAKQAALQYHRDNPERHLLTQARSRARYFKREFDLNLDDIMIPDVCPVLGIPMDSPSIDRIDNTRGYTRDNVRVISKKANRIKSNLTLSEAVQLVAYLQRNLATTSPSSGA